jgi:two-component system, NtrC family, sensor histidine kinase KinB
MTPTESLAAVAQSIENAKADLDKALFELDQLPHFDASMVGFVAHAMNNYLTIVDATVNLLGHALRDYPDRDVAIWLQGLRHTAGLMHHTVGRLLRASTPDHFQLKPEPVNVPLLMERACDYYSRIGERKQLKITCRSVGDVPPAWADRVAVAVVADNLLSNAVKVSPVGDLIDVQVMADPSGVVCSVRDRGPGMSKADQTRYLEASAMIGAVDDASEPAGFGLRVCNEFLALMDGSLWIESEPGSGARVSFRLPYHPNGTGPHQ